MVHQHLIRKEPALHRLGYVRQYTDKPQSERGISSRLRPGLFFFATIPRHSIQRVNIPGSPPGHLSSIILFRLPADILPPI